MENMEENRKEIGKIQKKSKLNSEMMRKLSKKSKSNSEKIGKIRRKSKLKVKRYESKCRVVFWIDKKGLNVST